MRPFIEPRRLLAGIVVLAALFIPVYFVLLEPSEQTSVAVSNPLLLKTPPNDSTSKVGLDVGQLAPDFEISTTDGRRVRLSDFRGRPVVINFFALWCTSCLTEMPEIKAAQEERGIDTFAVLAVNAGETRERALEFVDFLDAPFTYGLDLNLAVSDAYRVLGLPATVFVDSQGVIQTWYAGYTGRERLNLFLDAAIKAQPPGDLPLVIRLINTIPRDRILTVEQHGDRELRLSSRSLRCDAGYCANTVIDSIQAFAGVSVVNADLDNASPTLTVRFDPRLLTREQVVDATVQALETFEDPVYDRPVTVTYATN
jgi:peroxiredoxin/copper chaperone CopZ